MKRIPPKGTPEYREYWRNRHVLEEMKDLRDGLTKMLASDPASDRLVLFAQSLAAFDHAIALFHSGHQLDYIKAAQEKTK